MDTGSVAFMLLATAMVFFMTPGLAFFYGGLGRRKNVISTMMMSVVPIGIAILMWILVGYSLSFSGQNPLIGDFGALLMQGVSESSSTKGYEIPDLLFAVYQMMFSIITVGIATGSIVGRMRFSPLVIWISLWLLLVYYPLAHMVWGGGLLAQMGALDFAGGNVVPGDPVGRALARPGAAAPWFHRPQGADPGRRTAAARRAEMRGGHLEPGSGRRFLARRSGAADR